MRAPTLRLPPAVMKHLDIKDVNMVRIMWSPLHIAALNTKMAALDFSHPRHESVKRRWEGRTDPLWWNCLGTKQVSVESVVRAWLNRRARVAFVNALKRKGYDTNGNRIDNMGDDIQKPNLVGSVQFLTRIELARLKWPEVEGQADIIVTEVERLLLSDPNQGVRKKPYNNRKQGTYDENQQYSQGKNGKDRKFRRQR